MNTIYDYPSDVALLATRDDVVFKVVGAKLLVEYADAIIPLRGGPRDNRYQAKKARQANNKNKKKKEY